MSNNQSKLALQRAVGGIFLLGLIALIAVLLLQPSDKLPNPTTKEDNPQKPRMSITADTQKPGVEEDNINDLVLESTSATGEIPLQQGNTEVIGENIWQSVEQTSIAASVESAIDDVIVDPNLDQQTTLEATPNLPPQAPEIKPTAEVPKLQLISDAQTTAKIAPPKTTPPTASTGKWYVQLGAFSNTANAQKLMNEFKQKGYNVRIQQDKLLNRVQIGPYTTKKEAEQVQSRTKGGSLNPSIFKAK